MAKIARPGEMLRLALMSVVILLPLTATRAATVGTSFCMEPRAPSLYIVKPTRPFCAASRSCSEFEVSSYKRSVDSYFSELRQYVSDVDRFSKKAYEYAQCMTDLD